MSYSKSFIEMCEGTASIITCKQENARGTVVYKTKNENKYVQRGSANHRIGQMYINKAATITPIDMSKSERTCKYAALIFISSLFYYSGV